MKLTPKARPVRCKLMLGGKIINTVQELREQFLLREILDLGETFADLLRRIDGRKEYSDGVAEILKSKNSDDIVAKKLIKLFFGSYKSLEDTLVDWMGEGKDVRILSSLLDAIPRDVSIARKLFGKIKGESSWMHGWLKEVSELEGNKDVSEYPDFCFKYSEYLERYDKTEAQKWLGLAARLGHKDAKQISGICQPEIKIGTGNKSFTMVRIEDSENGDFYISRKVIFFATREKCDEWIYTTGRDTGYKWDYPTSDQLKKARQKCVIRDKISSEWCKECNNKGSGVTFLTGIELYQSVFTTATADFRPVLNVKDNIKST